MRGGFRNPLATNIAPGVVDTIHLADLAVKTAKIDNLAVTNGKIDNLAVTTAKIDSLAVTNGKIATLDAGKITTGFLSANRISAKSLALEKLSAGSFDNLIQNPGAEYGTSPHASSGAGGSWTAPDLGTTSRSGDRVFRYDTTGQTARAELVFNGEGSSLDKHINCGEGDKFYLEIYVKPFSGSAWNQCRVVIQFRDSDNNITNNVFGTFTTPVSGVWTKLKVEGTAGTQASYVNFRIQVENDGNTGRIMFDDAYARRQIGSVILESDIQSDNFISGSSGWKLERDTGNLEANDGTFRGDLLAGTFKTSDGNDFLIINEAGSPLDLKWFIGGSFQASIGYLTTSAGILTFNGGTTSDLSINTGSFGDEEEIFFDESANQIQFLTSGSLAGIIDANGNWSFQDRILYGALEIRVANGSVGAPTVTFNSQHDTGVFRSSTSVVGIASAGAEAARFALNNIWLTGAKDNTTGSGANTFIQSTDGKIFRSTSSAKYKRKIKDWKPRQTDWDKVRVRSWESDIKGEKGQRFKGFVFEELPGVFRGHEVEDLRAIVAALVSRVKALEAAA